MIEERKNAFILIITDGYLHNWDEFLDSVSNFKNKNYEMSIVFIGETRIGLSDDLKKRIRDERIRVYYVNTPKDLFEITIREVNRVYA